MTARPGQTPAPTTQGTQEKPDPTGTTLTPAPRYPLQPGQLASPADAQPVATVD
jgi:hypothetical protein